MGLKDDSTNAGYNPANIPVNNINPRRETQIIGSVIEKTKGLSNTLLNSGRDIDVIPMASIPAIHDSRTDSVKNCVIKLLRWAPTTFRTATSFARY
jgi:hypothetical protein